MRALNVATKYALAFLLISCVSEPSSPRAQPRAGDPSIDGLDYLISEADFRAVLSVARTRLASYAPMCSINRVTVVSALEVEARFCEHDYSTYGYSHGTFSPTLQALRQSRTSLSPRPTVCPAPGFDQLHTPIVGPDRGNLVASGARNVSDLPSGRISTS